MASSAASSYAISPTCSGGHKRGHESVNAPQNTLVFVCSCATNRATPQSATQATQGPTNQPARGGTALSACPSPACGSGAASAEQLEAAPLLQQLLLPCPRSQACWATHRLRTRGWGWRGRWAFWPCGQGPAWRWGSSQEGAGEWGPWNPGLLHAGRPYKQPCGAAHVRSTPMGPSFARARTRRQEASQ